MPLGDEEINSSLVEIGRSLIDPPHPFLHFLARMKPTDVHEWLPSGRQNMEITRGKIWAVRSMLKCFPAESPKLITHQIDSMGVIMQKDDSVRQHSRALWLYDALKLPQLPINEPHLSALLSLSPFTMLDEHTLHYAQLQSNKETTTWICAFSLCMSSTLQTTVSIRNNSVASFWEECVLWRVFSFHLTVLIFHTLTLYETIQMGRVVQFRYTVGTIPIIAKNYSHY